MEGHKALKSIQISRGSKGLATEWEEEQPLSPMARLFHQPGASVYIIGILGSKTKLISEVAKASLVHHLLMHPRFSSLQVKDEKNGGMKWVPTRLNLDDHIVVPKLNPNMESADKFVEDYLSNLTTTTIDPSKPLWDLHLLDIKTTESEGIIIYRIHHSIGDGTSLMSLLLTCSRKLSDPMALPTLPSAKIKSSSVNNYRILTMIRSTWYSIIGVVLFVATALFLKDTKMPIRGAPGVESKRRRIIKRTISLDDAKLVKRTMNVTINDVVLGVTQAGLSRYLNKRYGEQKSHQGSSEENNHLPKNIRLRAIFFFNLRPFSGTQVQTIDLVDIKAKDTPITLENKIGYVVLPFSIRFLENPLDYIWEAKAAVDKKKSSFEPVFSNILVNKLIKLFGIRVAGFFTRNIFTNTTLLFSNVRGTEDEITYCGHEVSYYAPTCYGQPNSLMIHVVSYVNKLIFVVSAEEETIPDPHQLFDDIEDSFKLILDAVLSKQHA